MKKFNRRSQKLALGLVGHTNPSQETPGRKCVNHVQEKLGAMYEWETLGGTGP